MNSNALTGVWLAGIVLQILVVAVLLLRRVWRKYPVFLSYVLANLGLHFLLFLIKLTVQSGSSLYLYVFGLSKAAGLSLGLAVIFEVFAQLLTPYPTLKKPAMMACRCTVAVLSAVGILVIFLQPSGDALSMKVMFLKTEEAVRILQVGLVVFLCLFAGFFRLHWRQTEFGIAMGMGVFAAVDLVAVVLGTYLGSSATFATSMMAMLAFNSGLLIWLAYLVPARIPRWSAQSA